MNLPKFLLLLLAFGMVTASQWARASTPRNVVLIVIDDLGWRDLGEQHDLAQTRPDRAAELQATLHAWFDEVEADQMKPNPEYGEN